MIPQAEKDAKAHLDDSNDDGELHLDRIGEGDLVLSQLPDLKRRRREHLKVTESVRTGSRPKGYGVPEYIC